MNSVEIAPKQLVQYNHSKAYVELPIYLKRDRKSLLDTYFTPKRNFKLAKEKEIKNKLEPFNQIAPLETPLKAGNASNSTVTAAINMKNFKLKTNHQA